MDRVCVGRIHRAVRRTLPNPPKPYISGHGGTLELCLDACVWVNAENYHWQWTAFASAASTPLCTAPSQTLALWPWIHFGTLCVQHGRLDVST